ncbi:hypothetical protein DFO61_0757 [Ectopseudomonas oleovorans]|uniref:Uncharacterized protein n=1 Tax=Ectopseudomonas oleovorans TaxID=301 RepID=A0A397NFG5_ECTOL|nr:hypothetical protein [Pseudomonas oleovorans]RIA36292.1 hypothetical protein DFO61_0757 [Pseudomonas oleovorans]
MTHEREPLDHEQELLAHFRAHGSGEPSAELDARILAAASAAARETQQARTDSDNAGWAQRLHQWLFGSGRQRWSVAVAGLACVGIGVSLTWRTLEQTPEAFDAAPPSVAMSPAAPAPAPMSAKRAAESESMARMAAPQERMKAEAIARPAPPAAMADEAMSSATAIAPMAELVIQSEPREALLRLLALRKANQQEEAQRLLEQLKADYPQLDIEAELDHLANEPSAE